MREDDLCRVLLVEACEQSDPDGLFLSFGARRAASPAASKTEVDPTAGPESRADAERWIARRAATLATPLVEGQPAFRRASSLATLPVPGLWVSAVALLLGIGLDALGSLRRVNLLSFPLLGLLAWNVGIYAALAARRAGALRGRAMPALARLAERLSGAAKLGAAKLEGETLVGERRAWQAESLRRFFSLWRRYARDVLEARVARMLHIGAAAMALGAILGMYLSGIAFEYRATWESTFLDASEVHALLATLMAPASALLRTAVPSAAEVAALESPAHGAAAVWIHLWAVTVALVVLLPRIALAGVCAFSERRALHSLAIDLESAYVRRLLAPERGRDTAVEIQPYSYRPSRGHRERLRELLLELFGNRARLEFLDPLEYGADLPASRLETEGECCRVLVFNLAQSPEQEVHGALLEQIKSWAGTDGGRNRVLVVVDEEAFARRLDAGEGELRVAERRRAWERLARSCDLGVWALCADPRADSALRNAAQQLWPRPAAGSEGARTLAGRVDRGGGRA